MRQKESLRAKLVKRYLRFGIRKFTIGVASVAIASGLMMIGSHQIQAEETAPTSTTVNKEQAAVSEKPDDSTTKTTVTIKFVSEGKEIKGHTIIETGMEGQPIPEGNVQTHIDVIKNMGYTLVNNPFLTSDETKPKFDKNDKEIVITFKSMHATVKPIYALQGEIVSKDAVKDAVTTKINTKKEVVTIPSTIEAGNDSLKAKVIVTYGSGDFTRDEVVEVPVKVLPRKSVTSGITVLKGIENNVLITKVREHVTKELQTLKNLPSEVTVTIKNDAYATPKTNENKETEMDVTIQYKNESKVLKEITVEVPIKVVSSTVKSFPVLEGTKIPAKTVENSVVPGKGGKVEPLDESAIPDTTGQTKVEVPVTVKYGTDQEHPDLVEKVTVSIIVVAKPKPITVEEGTTITNELVEKQITLPKNSKITKIGSIPDTKTAGNKGNIPVTIELEDGQTLTLHVPVTVTSKAENGGNHSNQGEHSNNNVIPPKPSETKPTETNQTGWNFVNGKWYYKKDGKNITKKWEKINGKWYFFTPSGDIKNNGWEFVNGKWYYLEQSGAMKASQWFKSSGKWYYVNHSGVMEIGWLQVNGKWYYLEQSGAMKASQWFKLNEKWYYVNDSGELLVNTTTPDGYKVNENGEWINE
ncbi:YSIRK-type signal peptide-containing protein [Granulicatella elegans]|uniref:YSIRK-type signal peptide-containing protein n=1 Tax=Granulicatella elegans TaxID=137732 RepID=UPI001D144943|nr:YSIRK-type signal peptide-containing protein [Granulicatella elegans]UEA30692.1 YSIRK-type signal peptide-containing protein [Granulicatella elegans]